MTRRLLHHLIILAVALFGGPAPVSAVGEWTVICGADGVAKRVLFDFVTGAPAEPDAEHLDCERCGLCCAVALISPDHALAAPPSARSAASTAGASLRPSPQPGRIARAPPLI